MKKYVAFALVCCVWNLTPVQADVLWDNGSMVTHPGAGPGGVDVSMASSVPNAAGSNVTATAWRADEFEVTDNDWLVSQVSAFAYDTNFPVPRWSDATIEIRTGAPDGAAVGTASATWAPAGVNRVFNGAGNLSNEARVVYEVTADFGDLELASGSYWAVVTITHTESVNSWMPYVMEINPNNADDPFTKVGNALSSTDSGVTWAPWTVTTGAWNQTPEMPFVVRGSIVPEPHALGLCGASWLGLLWAAYRRRPV